MKKLLLFLIIFLIPLTSFAEKQKIEFQYFFRDSISFEKEFPFLINTRAFKSFKYYEPIANEENWVNDIYIAEFIYLNNLYYVIANSGGCCCGSSGCTIEIYSKRDNKSIINDQIPPGDIYLDGNILYFQYSEKAPRFEYMLD